MSAAQRYRNVTEPIDTPLKHILQLSIAPLEQPAFIA
jgi:hypothetical protein